MDAVTMRPMGPRDCSCSHHIPALPCHVPGGNVLVLFLKPAPGGGGVHQRNRNSPFLPMTKQGRPGWGALTLPAPRRHRAEERTPPRQTAPWGTPRPRPSREAQRDGSCGEASGSAAQGAQRATQWKGLYPAPVHAGRVHPAHSRRAEGSL